MAESSNPPAGFYPDEAGRKRWWDGNGWTDHYESQQAAPVVTEEPKKKKRVFFWIFMAVQALFVIWLVVGIAGAGGDASDCGTLTQQACNDAQDVGTGIGIFLIIILWVFVDALLGIPYAIYRLAKRP